MEGLTKKAHLKELMRVEAILHKQWKFSYTGPDRHSGSWYEQKKELRKMAYQLNVVHKDPNKTYWENHKVKR